METCRRQRCLGWVLLGALGVGLVVGAGAAPEVPGWVVPVLVGALIYTSLVQVPLLGGARFRGTGRFLAASLGANFLLVPPLAWALSLVVARDPALQLGVFLVLLVPCTDWFVVFARLGGGEARLAVAAVPVLLAAQLLLAPLWVGFAMGDAVSGLALAPVVQVALLVILGPVVLAVLSQALAAQMPGVRRWMGLPGNIETPLLGLVVLSVAAAHAREILDGAGGLALALVPFAAYLLLAPLAALAAGRLARLGPPALRTLAFNTGTRNSFVVLPVALALPAGWEIAAAALVLQPIVELAGMAAYLRWVPRLFPDRWAGSPPRQGDGFP